MLGFKKFQSYNILLTEAVPRFPGAVAAVETSFDRYSDKQEPLYTGTVSLLRKAGVGHFF